MNKLEYYTRQKDSWADSELQNLKKEYEISEMTISEIADIHKRTPGSIGYKLKALNIINSNRDARGYDEYRNSELYNEIVHNGKLYDSEKKKDKKQINIDTNEIQIERSTIRERRNYMINNYENDVKEIKKDIKELKKVVLQLTEMLKAIYEFEES
jgi:hypothetical protein